MKELLEPTVEDNNEGKNSNDDGDGNDDGNGGSGCGGKCNEGAAVVAKSTNDDDDYSNDDGNDGSGGGGKSNNQKYDNNVDGGRNVVRQGKDCTILMTMPFLMTFLMMIISRSMFRPFRMSLLAIKTLIKSWEPSPLLSFGDLPRDVVCTHEGSTGQSCSHRIDLR